MFRSRYGPNGVAFVISFMLAAFSGCSGTAEDDGSSANRLNAQEAEPSGQAGAASTATDIRVGGIPLRVELADDAAKREKGLMFRESLTDEEGMLFIYESERQLSFWMKNTPLALDIAFIDESLRIVDIQTMEPNTDKLHSSARPAMYALEVRGGWFAAKDVRVGAAIEF